LAMPYFRVAWRQLDEEQCSRESLYLLNISALALLKLGDAHGALAIEREIEMKAAALPCFDWRLAYISQTNIARLCLHLGDLEGAARSYGLAFATTMGVRSECEAVYYNVCIARLETRRGQLKIAFRAWLRAALLWVSARSPEALTPRVAKSLIGFVPDTPGELIERISRELLSSLARAARDSGQDEINAVTTTDLGESRSNFTRADCLDAGHRLEWAIGGAGWGIMGSSQPLGVSDWRTDTSNRRQLCSYICRIVYGLSGRAELKDVQTVLVDDRFGQELPTTALELLEISVRFAVPVQFFEDSALTLSRTSRASLEAHSRVELGHAVARVDLTDSFGTVLFKRGRANATVSRDVGVLLRALGDKPTLPELSARLRFMGRPEDLLRLLRALESSRMVHLLLSEDSCTAAGISWHSRVN
jgi:hypothetical protein